MPGGFCIHCPKGCPKAHHSSVLPHGTGMGTTWVSCFRPRHQQRNPRARLIWVGHRHRIECFRLMPTFAQQSSTELALQWRVAETGVLEEQRGCRRNVCTSLPLCITRSALSSHSVLPPYHIWGLGFTECSQLCSRRRAHESQSLLPTSGEAGGNRASATSLGEAS